MNSDPLERVAEYEKVIEDATRNNDPLGQQAIEKIERLIRDIETTDDSIYKVTCLQLVADLSCSTQALKVLDDKQVPQKLIGMLQDSDPLIVPHALKLFYRINPTLLKTKYPTVLNKICDYFQSDDKQLLDYAIDFVAALGRGGYYARKVLDNHAEFKEKCLTRLGSIIISSDTLMKSRTLRCITDLIEIHEDDPREESSRLSEQFYHKIIEGEQKMTNQLLGLSRYPFLEVKVNALLALAAVAGLEWGQQELAASKDFVKWILDRSTEKSKESKEAKFEILKTIVKSKTGSKVFGGENFIKMRTDFKNGPFHVGIAEEMLMEDQNVT